MALSTEKDVSKVLWKYVIVCFVLLLAGCSGSPTPEGAAIACIEKGWVVHYNSAAVGSVFTCNPIGNK